MRSQFPHAVAWSIVAVLLSVLVVAQWWQSCHAAGRISAQARGPAVEIIPEDRPERHEFDDGAFADEMNGALRVLPPHPTARPWPHP